MGQKKLGQEKPATLPPITLPSIKAGQSTEPPSWPFPIWPMIMPAISVEITRQPQVGQHTVDLVRRLVDVLPEDQSPFQVRGERRAQGGRRAG